MDYYSLFRGPGVTSTINEPRGALTCRSSTLAVFVDSDPFVDYYSSFWGPKVISMLFEQQDALTCRSSTLTVLAGSGPFHGLSLTILGSRSDFHD